MELKITGTKLREGVEELIARLGKLRHTKPDYYFLSPIMKRVTPGLGLGEPRMHETQMQITQARNGWIVKVGCQTFVFEGNESIKKEFCAYIDDPSGAYNKYMEEELRVPAPPSSPPPPAQDPIPNGPDAIAAPAGGRIFGRR